MSSLLIRNARPLPIRDGDVAPDGPVDVLVEQGRVIAVAPSLLRPPAGCPFFPRCEFSKFVEGDRCATQLPELLPVSEGHLKRCHLVDSKVMYETAEIGTR